MLPDRCIYIFSFSCLLNSFALRASVVYFSERIRADIQFTRAKKWVWEYELSIWPDSLNRGDSVDVCFKERMRTTRKPPSEIKNSSDQLGQWTLGVLHCVLQMLDQYWDLGILESDFLCCFGWSAISMGWGAYFAVFRWVPCVKKTST